MFVQAFEGKVADGVTFAGAGVAGMARAGASLALVSSMMAPRRSFFSRARDRNSRTAMTPRDFPSIFAISASLMLCTCRRITISAASGSSWAIAA